MQRYSKQRRRLPKNRHRSSARLKERSRPVADHKQRLQAATISAHNDAAIGETVADALEKVGAEGTTAVEEAKGTEMTVERVVRRGIVVDRMRSGTGAFGFDAGGTYVDLVEAGIIDPTKVVRIALENAVSAASVLLLTEATLTEVPNPSGKPAEAA